MEKKRKGCEYDICLDPERLFLRDNQESFDENNQVPKGWVSYRLVICHAIWNQLKGTDPWTEGDVAGHLEKLQRSLETKKEYTPRQKFLHIRKFEKSSDVLILDKTHGCYPLLLNKKRASDFKKALAEVVMKVKKILNVLKRHTHDKLWNSEIEEELRKDVSWSVPESNY